MGKNMWLWLIPVAAPCYPPLRVIQAENEHELEENDYSLLTYSPKADSAQGFLIWRTSLESGSSDARCGCGSSRVSSAVVMSFVHSASTCLGMRKPVAKEAAC